MKRMQRTTFEIILEHPATDCPLQYIHTSGGEIVKVLKEEVTKVEDMGAVEMPWDQKVREFNSIKKLLSEAVQSVSGDFVVRGTSNSAGLPDGTWHYWFEHQNSGNWLDADGLFTSQDYHRVELMFQKGVIIWFDDTKLNVGDPAFVAKTAQKFAVLIGPLKKPLI